VGNRISVCVLIRLRYDFKLRYFHMYINSLGGTSEAVHVLRARAGLTCLCMWGSLAELLEILDGKNNRSDGRHREWFFLILVSRSIMGPTTVGKRRH